MSEPKQLETLIDDIYSIIRDGKEFSDDSIRRLAETLAITVKTKWMPRLERPNKFYLRPSNLGTPERKLWFEAKADAGQKQWSDKMLLNFFFGDMWEDILLWLAEEADHKVEGKQLVLEMEGLRGSADAIIDGVMVDVKTTSMMDKFSRGKLLDPEGDPFGYLAQISYYTQAHEGKEFLDSTAPAAFLAADKKGDLAILNLDPLEMIDARAKIARVRKVLKDDKPPEEKCYQPKPRGTKGNMVLANGCKWCPFQKECWPDVRVFQYKRTREYFTEVEVAPDVPEITEELKHYD